MKSTEWHATVLERTLSDLEKVRLGRTLVLNQLAAAQTLEFRSKTTIVLLMHCVF